MKIKIGFTISIMILLLLLVSCNEKETVTYHGRSYNGPSIYTVKEFNQKHAPVKSVGYKVNGMEVMLSEEGQAIVEEMNTVPTLLVLKKNEEEYLVYSLQGGP